VIVLGRDQAALDVTMKAMRHRYIKKDQVCKADVLDLANPLAVPDKRPKLDRCLD
jgi:hypothetical protein